MQGHRNGVTHMDETRIPKGRWPWETAADQLTPLSEHGKTCNTMLKRSLLGLGLLVAIIAGGAWVAWRPRLAFHLQDLQGRPIANHSTIAAYAMVLYFVDLPESAWVALLRRTEQNTVWQLAPAAGDAMVKLPAGKHQELHARSLVDARLGDEDLVLFVCQKEYFMFDLRAALQAIVQPNLPGCLLQTRHITRLKPHP